MWWLGNGCSSRTKAREVSNQRRIEWSFTCTTSPPRRATDLSQAYGKFGATSISDNAWLIRVDVLRRSVGRTACPPPKHILVDEAYFSSPTKTATPGLDVFLAERMPDLSRSHIQKLIAKSYVTVDGTVSAEPGHKVQPGESIAVTIPPPEPTDIMPRGRFRWTSSMRTTRSSSSTSPRA